MAATASSEASLPPSSLIVLKPHPSSHGQTIKLSAIDQIAPRDYMSICLFFRTPHTANKERIFSILNEAVSRTVNDIPELACCVQRNTNNDREEVELLFDADKGVELHFKDYASPELRGLWRCGTFDQLEREHFPLGKMPRDLVFGTCGKLEGDARLPALVLQANFIPGGLILGGCLHHVAGDGQCNFMLWSTIGSHFEAISDGLATATCTPIHFLERSDVVEADPSATLDQHPDWKIARDTTTFLNPTTYDNEDANYEYATYFISAEGLSSLRKQFSALSPETKLGTVEALGGFVWRHVILARDIDPERYPEAKLSITIDARGRMSGKTVPSTYWGNFAEPNAVARLPTAHLQQPTSLTSPQYSRDIYPQAAQKIRKAIAAVDDKAVRRLVGLLKQMPKSTTLTWNADRCPGPDMLIVCIQGHAYNDIHFGRELGFPSALRVTVGDTEGKPDGRCLILPPRRGDGKGLEVALQYDSATLKRLEDNAEFAEFFTRRN